MTDVRSKIIEELDVLRRVSAAESGGTFKVRAYATAIKTIQGLPPIHSVTDIPPSVKGDGLGTEIRKKMEKIITSGSLNIAPDVRAKADALAVFQNIYGVGPKKAEELAAAGYKGVVDLRAANPKLLNKNQQIGLRYYEQLLARIPRAEMDRHAAILTAAIDGVIVGSYRRGRPDSGDIDMLIRTTALADCVAALRSSGYIREILAMGDHKCMAICDLDPATGITGRRLDLLVTPPDEFPFAVFYFTGCDTFNVAVRSHALRLGFTLNEHALTHIATGLPVKGIKTEQDIFAALKLTWREPVDRTGPDAVKPL